MAMATPATARRSDPHPAKLHSEYDVPTSPVRTPHRASSRTSTPRPSISPLSTASRAAKNSPIHTRDAGMGIGLGGSQVQDKDNIYSAPGDDGDIPDDRSSSLSEPEDDLQDEDMDADLEGEEEADVAAQLISSRDSDADSEAETERLEQTPQKLNKHSNVTGRTPSKLRDIVMALDDDELSEPPSPLPTGIGAASSTSTIGANGKKRKRSDADDSPLTSEDSEIDRSPRKRSHGANSDVAVKQEGNGSNGNGVTDGVPSEEHGDNTPVQDNALPTKGPRGRKSKQKGKKSRSPIGSIEREDVAEADMEHADQNVLTAEETSNKAEASTAFFELAKQFTAFRDRLYAERIASVEAELQLLSRPNSTHPEYLRQVACVDARRAKQIREAHAYYHYRSIAVKEQTLGERAQRHSQYFQGLRELREDVLYKLGEDWYAIRRERQQQGLPREEDERHIYRFQPKRSLQIRQQAKYNQEVSILSGVAKYVGFPAAPETTGVEGEQAEDDFKAMKVSRRAPPPPPPAQHQPVHVHPHPSLATQHTHNNNLPGRASVTNSTLASSERLAHEQFIEQNPWARAPQSLGPHPIYAQHGGAPNLTHTPDWAEPATSAGRGMGRFGSVGMHATGRASPFATPLSVQKGRFGTDRMQDEHEENAVLASAAQQERLRIQQQLQRERERDRDRDEHSGSSPLNVSKQRRDMYTDRERELTDFRNISNISGTSTIDAPLDGDGEVRNDRERDMENDMVKRAGYPGPTATSTAGFRVAEGSFGTPTPGPAVMRDR